MRTFIFLICLMFASPAFAQVDGSASAKPKMSSQSQKALARAVKRLYSHAAQIKTNISRLRIHSKRLRGVSRTARVNRAQLVRLSRKHRSMTTQIQTFEKTMVTTKQFRQFRGRVAKLNTELTSINDTLTGTNNRLREVMNGRLTPGMAEAVDSIVNGVLVKTGGVIDRLVEIEGRLADAERRIDEAEGRISDAEKRLIRPGVFTRFVVWSPNRESTAAGFSVGPTFLIPIGPGSLNVTPGIGYGGTYGDHSTMLVDLAIDYQWSTSFGLFVGGGLYYGSTHGFFEKSGDVSPTISQFLGARALVGWDFGPGYVALGGLVGDDGHVDLGHDVSTGMTVEAQFSF